MFNYLLLPDVAEEPKCLHEICNIQQCIAFVLPVFFLCSSLKSHFRLNTLHIKLWLIFLSPDANTIRDTEHLLKIAHRTFHLLAFFSSLDRSQTIRAFMPLVERELLNSFHRLIRTKGSALHRARGFRLLKGCGSLSSLQAARERTEYIGLHHC